MNISIDSESIMFVLKIILLIFVVSSIMSVVGFLWFKNKFKKW